MIAAIVPAAGQSRRMGRPKLVLPIAGVPLVGRVVDALRDGGVDHVLVVTAPVTEPGATEIGRIAIDAGASVSHLESPTADMRATIQHGVMTLQQRSVGEKPHGVVIVPGDCVGLTPALVAEVLGRFRGDASRIVVPARNGKRGHPLVLPWAQAIAIAALPADAGVNRILVERSDLVDEVEVASPGYDADIDTPEEYEMWAEG